MGFAIFASSKKQAVKRDSSSSIKGSVGMIAPKHSKVFNPSNVCQVGYPGCNLSFAKKGDECRDLIEKTEAGIRQSIEATFFGTSLPGDVKS